MPILFAHTHITQVYYWVRLIRSQIRLSRCLFFLKHIFLCIFAQYYAQSTHSHCSVRLKSMPRQPYLQSTVFQTKTVKRYWLNFGLQKLNDPTHFFCVADAAMGNEAKHLGHMALIWNSHKGSNMMMKSSAVHYCFPKKDKSTFYTYLRYVTELFIFERFPNTLAIKVYVNEHVWEA